MAEGHAPRAVIAGVVAAVLAACGQKGPLYLPEQPRDIVTRPSATPAPDPAPGTAPAAAGEDAAPPAGETPPATGTPDGDEEREEPGAAAPR